DRKLAGLRAAERAIDADKIAQVETLCEFPVLFAHLLLADEELDAARPILDIDEEQLALVAQEHDAAGRADGGTDDFSAAGIGEPLAEVEPFLAQLGGHVDGVACGGLEFDFACSRADIADE